MAETALPTPSEPAAAPPGGYRHTYWFLASWYLLAVMWGIRDIHRAEPSHLDLLFPIALGLCPGSWAIVDARRRRRPIPMLSHHWFVLKAELLVPGYILWSRGWRGAGWMILHSLLWYALAMVALLAGGVAMYGADWLRAFGG